MSQFTHFLEDFDHFFSFFLVKYSVSWVRRALLHDIYCILYVKVANLQLRAKNDAFVIKLAIKLLRNISMAIFALAGRLSTLKVKLAIILNIHNKTISDGGITVDFSIIKVYTYN